MKCPLMVKEVYASQSGMVALVADCLKADCSWWNKGQEICEVTQIAIELSALSDTVAELYERLPEKGK